ncbi:hypothetical protein CA265_04550 [Sphingobacteriaceae bacterium GW460-11-11-14-LB5]|nr:hypothetical protein CA265_04550 [Sphingobacteriaceae bacterium GW460-11-11-14-LB5]
MKNHLTNCLIVVCLTFANGYAQKKTLPLNSYKWFPFMWHAAKISGKQFDKVAILVPAKIDRIPAGFILQFDLGSDATSVYGNTLSSYYTPQEYDAFIVKSAKYTSDAGHTSYDTKGLQLKFGAFSVNNILLKDKYGDEIPKDSLYTKSPKILGTLGADAFKDKILVIDYSKQRMCVLDEMDDFLKKKTTFVETRYQKGRLHIPFTIKNNTYWLLFDTGASLFPINTNKNIWTQLVGESISKDTIEANSWGEKVKFYAATSKKMFIWVERNLRKMKHGITKTKD